MNIPAYLYIVNKNNSFKLDTDEMKDVLSEINILLLNKSLNDLLTKRTVLRTYIRTVNKKKKSEDFILSEKYNDIISEENADIESERMEKVEALELNNIQKRIVKLLISGLSYTETRRKLRISKNQLFNHIARIKKNNLAVV